MRSTPPLPLPPGPEAVARLRLLFVADSVGRGGAETQLVRVATGCAERGHDVRVAALIDLDGLQAELAAAGVPLTRGVPVHGSTLSWPHAPAVLGGLWRLARTFAPDAVIGFDFHATMLARILGRLTGTPVVVSSLRGEHIGGRLRDITMRASDGLTTVTASNSRLVAAALVQRGVVARDRVEVIPNGLDVDGLDRGDDVRRRVRQELCVDDDTFVWIVVAHLRPEKDVATVIAAAGLLARTSAPAFQVVVVGGGDELERLQREAAAAGLDDHVRFLGRQERVPDLLAAADGFVLTSRSEGMPNAVMEAQTARLPVVATAVGGVPELVDDGVTGYLVPVGDPGTVARRMEDVMALSRPARAAMGARGRAAMEREFGLERLVDRWEGLLLRHVRTAREAAPDHPHRAATNRARNRA